MHHRRALLPALSLLILPLTACVTDDVDLEPDVVSVAKKDKTIDPRRSLVVTEQPILERFSLERVFDQLVAQSGVPGLTSLGLFHQWWDTQGPSLSGLGLGPNCDSQTNAFGEPVLNGYPYQCRRAPSEAAQAACDPFTDPETSPCGYLPIGLFNRFDLAPVNGAHCGEHRIVYAKQTGRTVNGDRVLVIVETILPNPHPNQGIKGCKKVVDVWADLSKIDDLEERAERLEALYFDGVANLAPVIHVAHLGDNPLGAGQIRTNQFSNLAPWSLREFKLKRTCAGGTCTAMQLLPVTVKGNPYGLLFSGDGAAVGADFAADLAAQVPFLTGDTLAGISMSVDDVYNSGQSQVSGSSLESNYVAAFQSSPSGSEIRLELAGALSSSAGLSVDQLVARAQTQSCAGCHRLSNNADLGGGLSWPPSQGFTHISERDADLEVVDGVTRFGISDALTEAFLPHRKLHFESYLNDKPKNANSAHGTVGGAGTH